MPHASLEMFFDPVDIEHTAEFAQNHQDAHVAPSTKYKYNRVEQEYKQIMEQCPWRKDVTDVILARPDIQDLKYFIRMMCIIIQKKKTAVRIRTIQAKVWTILALVFIILSQLLMFRLHSALRVTVVQPLSVKTFPTFFLFLSRSNFNRPSLPP